MTVSLEDRGRALEDEFFNRENAKKLEALKHNLDVERSRDELRKASGMSDVPLLDKLMELGLSAPTVTALSLVPLVTVAWADGSIADNERAAILQGAHGKGFDPGSAGYQLLEGWLTNPPSDKLMSVWEDYIKVLSGQLSDEQHLKLRSEIVGFSKLVATSAGGILGIAKVSSSEEKVLNRIEAALKR
jgi:hypothetical protein